MRFITIVTYIALSSDFTFIAFFRESVTNNLNLLSYFEYAFQKKHDTTSTLTTVPEQLLILSFIFILLDFFPIVSYCEYSFQKKHGNTSTIAIFGQLLILFFTFIHLDFSRFPFFRDIHRLTHECWWRFHRRFRRILEGEEPSHS